MLDRRAERTLNDVVAELVSVFRRQRDKYAAHRAARPILEQAARDSSFLTGALQKHVLGKGGLDARNYPVLSLVPATETDFSLAINCWIPLPDGSTELSTKSIHHHGTMLLSTANVFGPGYEHLVFTPAEVVDEARDLVRMKIASAQPHRLHEVAFVDAWTPHVPMYPSSLTVTAALWSTSARSGVRERLKKLPFVQRHKKTLGAALRRVGLARSMNVNVVEFFDYYPAPEGDFYRMRERQEFALGPNEHYLASLCHTLQGTGNEGLSRLMRERLAEQPAETQQALERLLPDLERGRPIAGRLSEKHYDVPHANFTKRAIERATASHAPSRG